MKDHKNQPDENIVPVTEQDVASTIQQRFARIAKLYPDKTAIKSGANETSYAELNRLSRQIAISLFNKEIDETRPIALFLRQGVCFISGMLGVIRYGSFFIALDPDNPEQRNRQILDNAGSVILLTSKHLLTQAKELFSGRGMVSVYEEMLCENDKELPGPHPDGSMLAYVLYTSGSTGLPKGVMHSHSNVLHNVMRHTEAFGITASDRQTLLYTCGVYGGIRDIFNALLNGASLHVYSVKQKGVSELPQWLRQEKITIYCSVVTVFRHLIRSLDEPGNFQDIRLVKLGGEASSKSDVDMFKAHFPSRSVMHCGFGSTETGVARHFFVNHDTKVIDDVVPLGYPVKDMDVILTSENGTPVGAGQRGEIAIKSRYVALGYWNNSELTASRFKSVAEDPLSRLYLTGDFGDLDRDGCLIHGGRKDHQVKIRGNRIELGDVQHALMKLDAIQDACVVFNETDFTEPCLIAYYIATNDSSIEGDALREKTRKYLPEFMVPTLFIEMQNFPLLPNGKLDRSALPRPQLEQYFDPVVPGSQLEMGILEIWLDVFDVDQIGLQTNFFSIGGNSLIVTRISSRITDKYDVDLELVELFSNPTIRQQALLLLEKLESI